LAVTLNAMTFVSELVSAVGRPARPRVVRVGDFSVVEVFRRASLVRAGMWPRRPVERVSCESERGRGVPSSEPCASQNMVEAFRSSFWLVPSRWAEFLAWFSQGFIFLDRLLWVPLVLVPDSSP
jgi:hypothetical protein